MIKLTLEVTKDVINDIVKEDSINEEQNDPIEIPRGSDDNSAEDRKLFLGGLSWETKEPQLKEYFEKFGEIESINLKVDPVTGRSRCFAFLVFKETSSIDQVIKICLQNMSSLIRDLEYECLIVSENI